MTTPNEVVTDSSVITALVTLEEQSNWAQQKMTEHTYFHALDLNYYEIANAIKHKISNRFTPKDAQAAFSKATELMNLFALHKFSDIINDAFTTALNLNVTIYDAAFLSLADKLNIPLLTLDEKLAKKLENTKYYRLLEWPNK